MTATQAYNYLCEKLKGIYDDREGAIISRYLLEDLFDKKFWSEDELSESEAIILVQASSRLLQNEPWQYIGGFADFYGLKFKVNSSVLIPRPETEELVYLALDIIKRDALTSVLDIGTGSGIIPITLTLKSDLNNVFGLDVSLDALEVAKSNGDFHNVEVNWFQQDILNPQNWPLLPQVDMVISNPPYITPSEGKEMHPNVLDHEPNIALFVKNDAMEFYEAISSMIIKYQPEGCILLVEINEKYGDDVCKVFKQKGLKNISLIKDLQDKNRIVIAVK
jgi:release factor glutamine methyltransferase